MRINFAYAPTGKFETWAFISNGRAVRHIVNETDVYNDDPAETTYMFVSAESPTSAKYKIEGDETEVTFSYNGNTLYKDGTKLGDFNTDPGAHFLVRVAGWTFEGDSPTKYEFSADGATLKMTYKNWRGKKTEETYTWKGDNTASAETEYGGYAVLLADNDNRIVMKWSGKWQYDAYRTEKASEE